MECTLWFALLFAVSSQTIHQRNGELAVAPIHTRKAVVAEHSLKSRKRVLEVEDDPDIREMVSKLLLSEGYEVVSRCTVKTHSRRWRAIFRPDVILLDLMMPLCLPKSRSERWHLWK